MEILFPFLFSNPTSNKVFPPSIAKSGLNKIILEEKRVYCWKLHHLPSYIGLTSHDRTAEKKALMTHLITFETYPISNNSLSRSTRRSSGPLQQLTQNQREKLFAKSYQVYLSIYESHLIWVVKSERRIHPLWGFHNVQTPKIHKFMMQSFRKEKRH